MDNIIAKVIEIAYAKKLEEVADVIIKKLQLLLEGTVGHPTKLSKSFKYKIEGNELKIYSTSPIVNYLDKGTKPHIIRPKNKKALAFRTSSHSVTSSNGNTKYGFGDTVIAKEVHHPGFEARPFISMALFSSKPQIIKVLAEDSKSSPTLTFVLEGDNLYRL